MAQSLAQVLKQIARKKAESREIKRVEVIGVLPDGTHLLASGDAAKVSGRAEFRPGEIVDVLQDFSTLDARFDQVYGPSNIHRGGPRPEPLILGHKWQKGDVPTVRVRQAVEEVEEIIMTLGTHPDGGLDFFLRSWRGLFYLDFRAAVNAVVTNPALFVDTDDPPGTRFPIQSGEHVQFGFNDNVLGILVLSPNNDFGVIYVFQINRVLHSDEVPIAGEPYVLADVEYPRVNLSLLALYDFSTMNIPTDITLRNVGSVGYHQGYYDLSVLRTGVWNPSPPGGYDMAADVVLGFDFSTPVSQSFPFDETVNVVIDFAHCLNIVSGSIHPYQWGVEHFWIGPEDHPFLAVSLENSYGLPSAPFNRLARNSSGTLVPAQDVGFPLISPAIITVGSRDFAEHAALVLRLDLADGLVGGELVARSCPAALVVSTTTDYTDNVPGKVLPGATPGTCLGTHTVQQVLSGGGPTDGTTFIRVTDYLFIFSTIPSGAPPFGSASTTQQEPGTYVSTLPKAVLTPFFPNAPTVGSLGSTVWYLTVAAVVVVAEFTHTIVSVGFDGDLPGAFWAVRMAISRPKSLSDVDLLFWRTLNNLYGWRIQAGVDALVIYPTGAAGLGIINKPHMILNRDFVLFEGSRLCSIDGSTVVHFPTEFGPSAGSIFALVAPDRLFDERDSVGKFRSTDDPTSILAKPKPLPSFAALAAFDLFLSTPVPDIIHTVGTRTDKVSG